MPIMPFEVVSRVMIFFGDGGHPPMGRSKFFWGRGN